MPAWHLYLLRTRDGALYTGITKDVPGRLARHASGAGAKALRARAPLSLVYQVLLPAHGLALKAEYAVKQLSKARKEALVAAGLDGPGLCNFLGLASPAVGPADSSASDGVRLRQRARNLSSNTPQDYRGTDMQTALTPIAPAHTFADDEARWVAVTQRSRAADGQFYYAVRTTGVYCRPSCPSRPAKRENVSFHPSAEAAERAGYRACKRCKPASSLRESEPHAGIVAACRVIEAAAELPNLDQLAQTAGLSRFHFHRLFKAATGLTPKAYASAHRGARVRAALTAGSTVTDAIYAAGYNSNARFYSDAPQLLGMTPSAYRAGGLDAAIRFAIGECSLGSILVAATDKGLCAILLGDDPSALARDLEDRFPRATLIGDDSAFAATVALVVGFVEAPRLGLELPLDIRGTAFQQRVWQALREIPAGRTASYAEIAESLGMPKAVRAVAQACGANALAVAIPCHRVVRSDGSLSGYRWGVHRKQALLEREAHG